MASTPQLSAGVQTDVRPKRRVERVGAEAGQRERGRRRPVEQRHFDAIRLGEDVRPVHTEGGDDHHRQHQRRADRPQQAEGDEHAARDFSDRGGRGEQAPGAEAQAFEEPTGARQSVAAEPAKQLLRAVRCHQGTNHEPNENQACIHCRHSFINARGAPRFSMRLGPHPQAPRSRYALTEAQGCRSLGEARRSLRGGEAAGAGDGVAITSRFDDYIKYSD